MRNRKLREEPPASHLAPRTEKVPLWVAAIFSAALVFEVLRSRRAIAFLSGFAALAFEILWARRLTLFFGGTVFAATAVLCAYTLGAAFGAAVIGPAADRSRRPERLLGLTLLGLAVFGWAAHQVLIPLAASVNAALFGSGPAVLWQRHLVRFGFSLLALLPPSVALGAMVPVLSRCVTPGGELSGLRAGLVWAASTTGAVLGATLTGFLLIAQWGVTPTLYLAAGLALLPGAAVLAGWWWLRIAVAPAPAAEVEVEASLPRSVLGMVVALAGAAALGTEALLIRALVFFLGGSTYTFTVVAATFLAGLAVGAFISAPLADRWRRPLLVLGWLFLLTGLATLGSILLAARFDAVARTWNWAFAAGAVVLGPAILSGMCMPIFIRLATIPGHVGGRVGWVSALFNAGGAVGAAGAVVWLVPAGGVAQGLLVAGALSLVVSALVLSFARREGGRPMPLLAAKVACLGALALVVLFPRRLDLFRPTIQDTMRGGDSIYYHEGPDVTVSVIDQPSRHTRSLLTNANVQGDSTELGTLVQWRQGLIPVLLHPAPKRVCLVGLGTGATAFAASTGTQGTLDVVEISPGVVDALRHFPPSLNGAIYDDPNVRFILEDGRAFIANTENTYDVIIVDIVYPHIAGAGNLFSRDFYRQCYRRLNPGGILCHWVPGWQMHSEDLSSAAQAFEEAAGRDAATSLWCAVYSARQPVFGFVGVREALEPPIEGMVRRRLQQAPQASAMLKFVGLSSAIDVYACHMKVRFALPFRNRVWPNSDEHPMIEFSSPRRPMQGLGAVNLELLDEAVALSEKLPSKEYVFLEEEERRSARPSRLVIQAQLRGAAGDAPAEAAAYREIREVGWDDPTVAIFEREAEYDHLLRQADEAFAAGRTVEACQRAEAASTLDPLQPEAFGVWAEYLVAADQNDSAAEIAKRAHELDPAEPRWRLTIARARYNERNYGRALSEVNEVLETDPDHLDAHRVRQKIYERVGPADKARQEREIIERLERAARRGGR